MIVIIIIILASILYLHNAGAAPFWYDEAFTGLLMRCSLGNMLNAIEGDTHPPLYYLIVWVVTRIVGVGVFQIRFLSALFTILTIIAVWYLSADYLKTRSARILATCMSAVMPAVVWYAQEARMYAMFTFEFLITLYLIKRRQFLPISLGISALLFTHNYGLFYVIILFIYAVARELPHPLVVSTNKYYSYVNWNEDDRAKPLELLLSFLTPVVIYTIIWLPVLLGQMKEISGNYWIMPVTFGSVLYVIQMLFLSHAAPDILQTILIMLAYGLFLLAIYQGIIKKHYDLVYLVIMPIACAVIASITWQPILLHRAFLPIAPIVYMLIATRFTNNTRGMYITILLVPFVLVTIYNAFFLLPESKAKHVDRVHKIITDIISDGDAVLTTNDGPAVTLKWVMPETDIYVMPTCDTDPGALSSKTRSALGLVQGLPDADRIIFIYALGPLSTQCEHDLANEIKNKSNEIIMIEDNPLNTLGIYVYERSN